MSLTTFTHADFLNCRTSEELRQIRLCDLRMMFSEEQIPEPVVTHIFQVCEALWLHNGDDDAPHAELTSGKCSNGFVDVLRVLKFSNLCHILAWELVKKIQRCGLGKIDWAIGSDHAGAALSHSVAYWLNALNDFTEKGEHKTQRWKRFAIQPEERVLQVEELVTTAGTIEAVRRGIRDGNPHPVEFAPAIACLIHRSDIYEVEKHPIIFLAHYDIKVWEPENCPLCANGSKRVRPKQNWAALNCQ